MTTQNLNTSKVLLMGRENAGKTSIKSIIFANYLARDTSRLHPTHMIEHSSMRFLGNMSMNLWDCGGQDRFMENYFETQRETIFQGAGVLIYVIGFSTNDSRNAPTHAGDLGYFSHAMESLRQFSPGCRVFVLIHKMDLVHENQRERVVQNYEQQLKDCAPGQPIQCFGTSIWDETLFKAWSLIVHSLIPDIDLLSQQLQHVCQVCEADEVVLFERNTFLVIAHSQRREMPDSHRFEKISNIVKQFKLSCYKVRTSFRAFQIKNSYFTATIEPFLQHSYIMLVISDPSVHAAATSANLEAARAHFSDLSKQGAAFGLHL